MSNKSEEMRQRYEQGQSVTEISHEMNANYSYVYGVIERYCTKQGVEMRKVERASKSDEIRALADQGMTVGAIAKQLNSNYSFVHSVVKKYRSEETK